MTARQPGRAGRTGRSRPRRTDDGDGQIQSAPLAPRVLDLLGLQQTVGNHTVNRLIVPAITQNVAESGDPRSVSGKALIARAVGVVEPATAASPLAAAGPLTGSQVRAALAWYRARPATYTKSIIQQIQFEVGVTPTGTMDGPTVQAVATFQSTHPPLSIDGKAGPRTLPAAFPGGLAKKESVKGYVKPAKQVESDWVKLGSAAARAKALADAVNVKLNAAGVPSCTFVVKDLGNDAGQFDFATWSLSLGQTPFSQATVTDAEAADIANTVYHEARHAEQWHMMARLRAGQGKSAKAIADEMGIPAAIAADATSKPLKKGSMDAVIAQGWYDSIYGAHADERNAILNEVEAADNALKHARAAVKKDPSAANQAGLVAAKKRFDVAYRRYRDLPEESDAFRAGDAVTEEYLAGGG